MAEIQGVNPPVLNDTDYVDKIKNSLDAIDAHDHTSGKGVQIPTAGIEDDAITAAKLAAGAADSAALGISGSVVGTSDTQTLSNKSLVDGTTNIVGSVDATKKLKFEVDGITTGTTRTATPPDADFTMVGTATTQTLSNKTFSDAVTLAEIATPSPVSGFGKIYFKSDGFLYQLNDDGSESKVGAGTGGINYISNPDAESNTTGYVTYADAAASTPVDGTGGSANITWTRSTSSPLRGTANFLLTKDAVNRQGEGVSYDFTVAAADAAKIIRISFDYKSSSAFADGDVRVYVYDVTNAQLIEPTARDLAANTVNGTYLSEFQTNSNSVAYRLILHVASVNASAYTIQADNFSVGPREIARGSVVTDWVSYTPTWTSVATSPAIGNGSISGFWRRVGDSVEIRIFQASGTTTTYGGSNEWTWSLPSGLSIDTAKLPATIESNLGLAQATATSSFNVYDGVIQYTNATTVSVRTTDATAVVEWNSTNPASWTSATANQRVILSFSAPVLGWSSNANISSDFGGRVIEAKYYLNANSATWATGASRFVDFDTKVDDTAAAVAGAGTGLSSTSGTGWRFVIPESGYYDVKAMATNQTQTVAVTASIGLTLYKNASVEGELNTTYGTNGVGNNYRASGSTIVKCVAGDYLQLQFNNNSGGTTGVLGGQQYTWVAITKIQSPATLCGSEVVSALYTTNAGNSIPNGGSGTFLDFEDKVYDTHNAVVGAGSGVNSTYTNTFRFVAPYSGKYRVSTGIAYASLSWGAGVPIELNVFVNGANKEGGFYVNPATATTQPSIQCVSTVVDLTQGQAISVGTYQTRGSASALDANARWNYFAVDKVN